MKHMDYKPNWISTKDKMPSLGEEILLYMPSVDDEIMESSFVVGYLESDGNFYFNNSHADIEAVEFKYITHWMPLPKKPMEGEQTESFQDILLEEELKENTFQETIILIAKLQETINLIVKIIFQLDKRLKNIEENLING